MNTIRVRHLVLLLVIALLLASTLACDIGGAPAKPTVTITAPTSDAEFEVGDEVTVLSSASDSKGVTRVELFVDGDLYRTDSSPSAEGEKSLAMAQTWTAEDPGSHTLSVVAYNADGAESAPWAVTIKVVEAGGAVTPPTPTTPGAPPPAATDTPPPPPPEATATTAPPTETVPPAAPTDTAGPDLPDLVLDGLSINPIDPDWGESIEVSVDVGNYGHAASGPYSVIFRYGSGDFDVCEWADKPPLPAGNGGTLHCTVDHVYVSFDTVATVDWRDTVDESNEDNNSMELAMEVSPAPLADLYISEIRVVPESPQQGSPAMVGVHIHNGGNVAASGFKVVWRSAGPTIGCQWDADPIGPGEARWYQCDYTYSSWNPNYTTTAIVDPDGVVDELDDDNNELVKMLNVRPD
jgi:hypothetical protein